MVWPDNGWVRQWPGNVVVIPWSEVRQCIVRQWSENSQTMVWLSNGQRMIDNG